MLNQPKTRRRGERTLDEREKEMSVIIGQNIKTLRAMTGTSQMVLAEELGVTFQQIQKYENGTNRVSAPKLAVMAALFNVPIPTFFSNTGLAFPQDGELPQFGKKGLRAARLVDTMPPKMQLAALRVLQSLGEGIDVDD